MTIAGRVQEIWLWAIHVAVACLIGLSVNDAGSYAAWIGGTAVPHSYYAILQCVAVSATFAVTCLMAGRMKSGGKSFRQHPGRTLREIRGFWTTDLCVQIVILWLFSFLNVVSVLYLSDQPSVMDGFEQCGFPIVVWSCGGIAGENRISMTGLAIDLFLLTALLTVPGRIFRGINEQYCDDRQPESGTTSATPESR